MIGLLVAFANAIVQAAGTDFYQKCRRLLGRGLGRFASRKSIEAQFDATRERISRNPDLRAAEVTRWTRELDDLLSKHPAAESDFQLLSTQLTQLASRSETHQFGIAGRDQYNIGRDATFIRKSND
jgi:hypothetical protein